MTRSSVRSRIVLAEGGDSAALTGRNSPAWDDAAAAGAALAGGGPLWVVAAPCFGCCHKLVCGGAVTGRVAPAASSPAAALAPVGTTDPAPSASRPESAVDVDGACASVTGSTGCRVADAVVVLVLAHRFYGVGEADIRKRVTG